MENEVFDGSSNWINEGRKDNNIGTGSQTLFRNNRTGMEYFGHQRFVQGIYCASLTVEHFVAILSNFKPVLNKMNEFFDELARSAAKVQGEKKRKISRKKSNSQDRGERKSNLKGSQNKKAKPNVQNLQNEIYQLREEMKEKEAVFENMQKEKDGKIKKLTEENQIQIKKKDEEIERLIKENAQLKALDKQMLEQMKCL